MAMALADVAAQPSIGSGEQLRPFRWLNRSLMLSSLAHILVQAAAWRLQGPSAMRCMQGADMGAVALAGVVMVQLVHMATIGLCSMQGSLWYN